MNSIVLKGKTYILKPLTQDDISYEYVLWLNDPDVNQYLEVRYISQTIETATSYIKDFYKEQECYIWGIYSDENKLIGNVNLQNINRHHNSAELGLMIGNKEFWGKSASEEAISLVLDYGFGKLSLNRVTGGTYSTNVGMIFTYKRLGFKREGVMRKCFLDGEKYVDGYRWGILSNEWKNDK